MPRTIDTVAVAALAIGSLVGPRTQAENAPEAKDAPAAAEVKEVSEPAATPADPTTSPKASADESRREP